MTLSFEQILIEVWRQALVENAKAVELGADRFPVKDTPKRRLRQVDFIFEGNEIRGLKQNPQTKSRWAQLARKGSRYSKWVGCSNFLSLTARRRTSRVTVRDVNLRRTPYL
jgi:hypothetical protein